MLGSDLLKPSPRRHAPPVDDPVVSNGNGWVGVRPAGSWERTRRTMKRVVLFGALLVVLSLSVRGLLASWNPLRVLVPADGSASAQGFPGAEEGAFAARFAMAFLTYKPGEDEQARAGQLKGLLDARLSAEAAVDVPDNGKASRAVWAAPIPQDRLDARRGTVRVAALVRVQGQRGLQTRYLSVPVGRDRAGGLVVTGFPAAVSPPAVARALPAAAEDPEPATERDAVEGLVGRFMPAYLAGGPVLPELLFPGARVVALGHWWKLMEVEHVVLDGAPAAQAMWLVVQVRARDMATQAVMTLRYRIAIKREAGPNGRWLVNKVEV